MVFLDHDFDSAKESAPKIFRIAADRRKAAWRARRYLRAFPAMIVELGRRQLNT